MRMTIAKLAVPVASGDWHDPISKWEVCGPGNERQIFETKANATLYKRIRAKASSFAEASRLYINS